MIWKGCRAARRAHHHHAGVAVQRQGGEDAEHRPRGVGQLVDEARQVVLEEALAVGLEEGDAALVVEQVRAGDAEIDLLPRVIERHALQAEAEGAVLGLGEGLGVEDLEADLAVGQRTYSRSISRTRSA